MMGFLSDMNNLMVLAGWIVVVFVGMLGVILLWEMGSDKIKLDKLISEPGGDASLSRFQFLIFTFVIAVSLFFVIAAQKPPAFPDVPSSILALLGISGGSYVISKGIQTSRDTSLAGTGTGAAQPAPPAPQPIPAVPVAGAGAAPNPLPAGQLSSGQTSQAVAALDAVSDG
jgi:hypothetical protein